MVPKSQSKYQIQPSVYSSAHSERRLPALVLVVAGTTMAEESGRSGGGVRVCVTGGAGFIGSWLVKKLLDAGYTVHATLRSIGDEAKVGLLRRLVPGDAPPERLRLFEADLYDAATFAPAIAGCQFVFLVATPFLHDATSTKYKNTAEAALDAARVILRQCEGSSTVKRVIYTSSMAATSPLKEDSAGFKDSIDESCWTPLAVDYPYRSARFDEYILSKLLSEKELLRYNHAGERRRPAVEVVTVPCSVVAGGTLQGQSTTSLDCVVSPVSRDEGSFRALRLLQRLMGSVPMVHVDDVCDALVFCMEQPSLTGRFLCSAAYPTLDDIVEHFAGKYPHLDLLKETETLPSVQAHTGKLGELGFKYKYGMEEILDESVECAVRLGCLDASKLKGRSGGGSVAGDGVRVCVTGGAGFIASWLVKKLLERGCTVHATLRSIGDEEKAGLLRRLVPGAAERLRLFEADLFDAATFAPAIAGCQFVFLIATPYGLEASNSKYKNTADAAVDAVREILRQCAESKTVKRVIHTASISTASPLIDVPGAGVGAAGYRAFIDESCWTPLDVDYPLRSAHFDKYVLSKMMSEKELLGYNDGEGRAFEVVTLPCGLVAGGTVLGRAPETLENAVSPVSRNEPSFAFLRLLQRLVGSVPMVHVDDVCDALVFCMDRPSLAGRFLCSAAYPTIHDIVEHFAAKYPHLDVLKEPEREVARVQPAADKLGELGFRYKYGMEEILDGSVDCAARLGCIDAAKLRPQEG
uniref:NAD-dependent epimerase/dehydratase domain-containing protein n=1 Tax=Oryza meridionalis TaxID=40149 RepID=A0A0E0E4I0_9ORYZ